MVAIDITKTKNGGVLKEIIKEGTGDESPVVGSQVSVHYTGTFLDGSKFDSSRDRNEPFQFTLKHGTVIAAWNIGVATMKKGETALFTCAPKYAYGKIGNPPKIPKNTTLKFEIELLDWKGQNISKDKDCSIEKFQITKGNGCVSPEEGAFVDIHLVGKYNNEIFEERDVEFLLGEGEDVGVVKGVEKALGTFRNKEKAKLKIKSKYAFKKEGKPEYNIPPNADVEYIVELKKFENSLKNWALDKMGRVEQSKILKEKGTKFFRENKFIAAIKLYRTVLFTLFPKHDYEGDLKKERNSLELSACLNLALCYLKVDQNSKARDTCNKVLKIDPNNEKALFRRGLAHLALASPEIAVKDFQEVLRVQPKNTAASKQIIVCNNLIKKQLAKEKKLYANMFDKFAQEDKQKEEEKLRQQPDVMRGTLGEWGQEERPGGRDATAFEKENPNILMLNANGTGEFQNM